MKMVIAMVEQEIFGIAQEEVTNAVRHAQASTIQVHLVFETAALRLEVRDDGQGFDTAPLYPPVTFGLAGMQERAARIGGTVVVTSMPGGGTVVTTRVPLGEEEE